MKGKQNHNTILNKQWRLNHMYKITNKDAELVTFRLNKAQQYLRSLELQQKKEL
tara:strand:+ start:347 stop:508 length:162 start_codon:yes stop_codon:yes gene_type:complete